MKSHITSIPLLLLILFSSNSSFAQSENRVVRQDVRQAVQSTRDDNKTVRKEIRALRTENRNIEGQIQISGAFALYPLVVRWADEFKKLYPNVRIDISAGGAGKGITDALTGMVDLGMVSREIHDVEVKKGAFSISVAKDAVVPTINSRNPLIRTILYRGLTRKASIGLWRTKAATTWGTVLGINSSIPVHVYTRSDACGAAETWAAWLGARQEDLEGTAVFGDPGVASVIQRDRVSIGFNNLAYAYDIKTRMPYRGIMVMPIDLNNNGRIDLKENFYSTADNLIAAIANGSYPTPPARTLYLVTYNKPTKPELLLFLDFILNEGQQYANETLYIPLGDNERVKQIQQLQ